MFTPPHRCRSWWPLSTALVAAASMVVAGGMYLSAARAASWLAGTMSAKETLRHARAVEFEATMARASAEHRVAIRDP